MRLCMYVWQSSTSARVLVQEMLLCFSSLCAGGGYNYQKKKKQKLLQQKAERASVSSTNASNTTAAVGAAAAVAGTAGTDIPTTTGASVPATAETTAGPSKCVISSADNENYCELLAVGPDQMSRLLQLSSLVLSSYKKCNISSLLDNYCPLQQPCANSKQNKHSSEYSNENTYCDYSIREHAGLVLRGEQPQTREVSEKEGEMVRKVQTKTRKKTKRGCRAGHKVRRRSPGPPSIPSSSAACAGMGAATGDGRGATSTHLPSPLQQCQPGDMNHSSIFSSNKYYQSVGDRLVEKVDLMSVNTPFLLLCAFLSI